MKQRTIVDSIDHRFSDIAAWAVNNRFAVTILSIVMLIGSLYFISKLQFDGSVEGFFAPSDPVYEAYKEYQEDFRSDEITYILYRVPKNANGPFDLGAMKTISNLTQVLEEEVPFVEEATSLANVEFMYAEGDTLIVDDLLIDFPENQEKLLEIKQRVMGKPSYVDYLINETGEYGAIYLEMSRALSDPLEMVIHDPEKGEDLENLYPQISDTFVREILSRPEFSGSGIEFFLTGDVPMNALYNRLFVGDSALISGTALVLIALISFIVFQRSLVGLLAPIGVVLLSMIMMLGVIGMVGWKVGLFITMAPTLICAIGVAQAVHILQEYKRSFEKQGQKGVAVVEAIKKVGAPCLLAAATTGAGFLVISISNLKGLAEFGIYAAIGVAFTFILSITLLVVFLSGSDKVKTTPKKQASSDSDELQGVNPLVKGMVGRTIQWNQRFPRAILLIFAVLFVWSFVGLSKLSVDFNFLDEFKDHVKWKQDTILSDSVMGGIMGVTYIIDTDAENGVKNVELLKAIERLQQFINGFPEVKKTFSIVDIVKDLNQSFNGNDPANYRITDGQELVSQYLLVYELSGGEELPEVVNLDFSRTVLEMRVAMSNASRLREIIQETNQFIADNPLPNSVARPTGMGYLWIRIADYVGETQITAYSLIFVIIAMVMSLAFGSIKIGLLSMIPNLAPIVITLGTMGWMGISMDYLKLMLATIAIGIAVDDTIHMMTRFRSRFYEYGSYNKAMTYSLQDVGPALIITTFILVGAFSAYLVSDLAVLAQFGILLGATIGLALLSDLFLLPAILMIFRPFGHEFESNKDCAQEGFVPLPQVQ